MRNKKRRKRNSHSKTTWMDMKIKSDLTCFENNMSPAYNYILYFIQYYVFIFLIGQVTTMLLRTVVMTLILLLCLYNCCYKDPSILSYCAVYPDPLHCCTPVHSITNLTLATLQLLREDYSFIYTHQCI